MQLQDIFDQLTFGELRHVKEGGFEFGGVQAENYPALISHINLALTQMYTRFNLSERELVIRMHDNITMYDLDYSHAASNTDPSNTAVRYILDTDDDPFQDSVMVITAAYNQDGEEIPINDYGSEDSIFTPDNETIQIPNPVDGEEVYFVFKSNHKRIPLNTTDTSLDVTVPDVLLEPLLCYVASRVYASRTGADALQQSASLYQKYNTLMNNVMTYGALANYDMTDDNKFERGQWA